MANLGAVYADSNRNKGLGEDVVLDDPDGIHPVYSSFYRELYGILAQPENVVL